MSGQEQTPPPTSSAELCRSRGWGVGTVLERIGLYRTGQSHRVRIRITAIGEDQILARRFAEQWNSDPWREIREPESGGWFAPEFRWRKVEGPAQGEEEEGFECHWCDTTGCSYQDTLKAEDRAAAAVAFKEKHGFWPESVGEDIIECICEFCNKPIFEDDAYGWAADGDVYWHKDCAEPTAAGGGA